jgi:WD40 repeat protein
MNVNTGVHVCQIVRLTEPVDKIIASSMRLMCVCHNKKKKVAIVHFDEKMKTMKEFNFIQFQGRCKISAMLMIDKHALIGNGLGQLQLIDPDTGHTIRQMNRHTGRIRWIVYCPELSWVIIGSFDWTARVWKVATGECVHELKWTYQFCEVCGSAWHYVF